MYQFVKSIVTLHKERQNEMGNLVFNKDDDLIVDFVCAATNIRAFNFSIPLEVLLYLFYYQLQSNFKIKEMAGKIIPAISSSNALVAALEVFEAIKVLNKKYEQL